ncbi:hypothetical protein LTR97_004513 [Elasticomyces elasticus]|uniref:Cytochrome P450 n=1 Tax=Elasticomyces elasticus TaxID=574655 RepID=A0AAN7WLL6_9PEZI|nr:hypothetical protein LTR97_004513 [Elasticomyces elasticus]
MSPIAVRSLAALIAPAQIDRMPSLIAFVLIPAVSFLTYNLLHVLYNITLHPLAKFPGPKLAAATRLYESYYELYLGGQYGDQILALHSRYGPIVRISPSEVHILDPTFFDELFNFNPELDKQIQVNDNLQQTPGFELSCTVNGERPSIHTSHVPMCTRVEELKGQDTPFSMSTMYRCLTTDIISEYCFSQPFDLLDDPQGNEKHMDAFLGVFKILFLTRQIPCGSWVMSRLELLPNWMVPTDQGMAWVQDWQGGISRRLRDIKQGKPQETHSSHPHPTVFEQYIQNGNVPAAEKTDDLLLADAVMFVAAGLETTGFALSTATFHVLNDPSICQTLKAEIAGVWPSDGSLPSLTSLEKLPYLTACLKEALRMSIGMMTRMHRVNYKRPIQYKQWSMPPGTLVAMGQRYILYDPAIFPEPKAYRPERWLAGDRSLDKWFVVFARGARGCIGQQ